MKSAPLTSVALGVLLFGCAHDHPLSPQHRDLPALVGKRATFNGIAEPRKLGAALKGDSFYVWIDGLHDWPSNYVGRSVEVVGLLEERYDLPVFIQKPDKPLVQGIPVPQGTDLHDASRRFVVRDAKWRLLR